MEIPSKVNGVPVSDLKPTANVSVETIVQIANVAEPQSGLIATAQLTRHGLAPEDVAGLVTVGYLVDTYYAEDVWRIAGTTEHNHEAIHATWIAAREHGRNQGASGQLTAAGETAAVLLDIGDYWPTTFEFVAEDPAAYVGFDGIEVRLMSLDRLEVFPIHGIPTMTRKRTIVDLVEARRDLSLLANALRDIGHSGRPISLRSMSELLDPLAPEHCPWGDDGEAFTTHLYELAGLDHDGLPRSAGGTTGARPDADPVNKKPQAGENIS